MSFTRIVSFLSIHPNNRATLGGLDYVDNEDGERRSEFALSRQVQRSAFAESRDAKTVLGG